MSFHFLLIYIVAAISLVACEKSSPPLFKAAGDSLYSPAMVSPALLSFAGCRKVYDPAAVKEEIARAREVDGDFHVLREDKKSIVIGYSENAASYYFNKLEDCQAYTDNLEKLGWRRK